MMYPFPGMNPWLEDPLLWHDVHNSLIVALREFLAPRLRPRYFVAVETHTYVTVPTEGLALGRYPDVMVIERGGPALMTAPAQESTDYVTVELPTMDPLEEGYLEVRLVPTGQVVTVIEILSHANKQRGRNREEYLVKRDDFMRTNIGFVEIDLLRAGPPMPFTEQARASDYRLIVRRRERPAQLRVYPFNVRDAIPMFRLPLLADDPEPVIDLYSLLEGVYDRAGYDLVIQYAEPPIPALSEADAAWAAQEIASTSS